MDKNVQQNNTVNNKENRESESGEKTPPPAPVEKPIQDFLVAKFQSELEAKKQNEIEQAAGPYHSDKPRDVETDTDLFKQIGEYYKANTREWTDGVCQVLPGRYDAKQLKSMLEEYAGYAFAWKNKYATFAQHHAEFKRWVKRQPTMQKEQAATRTEAVNPNIPRYS